MVAKRLAVLPLALTAVGFADLRHSATVLTGTDIGMLVLSGGVALALGALRGATIELLERAGRLWQRYRIATLAAWAAVVAARLGLGWAAHAAGATAASGTSSLLLTLGLTLVGEATVVTCRAAALGLPPAAESRRR
ncbi:hypothetical protein ABZ746_20505 [Streptomyces sp. NPDC020096]